jgi:hypothetical protein
MQTTATQPKAALVCCKLAIQKLCVACKEEARLKEVETSFWSLDSGLPQWSASEGLKPKSVNWW